MVSERLNSRMLKLVRRNKKVIRIAKGYLEQKGKQECKNVMEQCPGHAMDNKNNNNNYRRQEEGGILINTFFEKLSLWKR